VFELLGVVLAGIGTYVERVIFLVTKKVRPPARSLRYLPLVGPAVLGAIAVPGIFAPAGELSFAQTVPALVAAVVAWLLWRWTKQLVIGLVGGLLVWWALIFALVQLGLR
jgi:branched-subunit amino acid transport protein